MRRFLSGLSDAPASWSRSVRWAALIALSLLFATGLEALRLPAALMLGPMFAAILMATGGGKVGFSRPVSYLAQGVVGMMIASKLPVSVLGEVGRNWPLFLFGTASTLIVAAFLGWLVARASALPGTTAIWGSSPGGATAMTLMSESFGADIRLVAFMQYFRVVACVVVSSAVAQALGGVSASAATIDWWPGGQVWSASLPALALACLGAGIGYWRRVPGGGLIVSMGLGIASGLIWDRPLVLPMPVLALSYALIGWGIGMRFTREVVAYAARLAPRLALSVLTLILFCIGIAAVLVIFAGIDPLTAYLATSPGGADSVAIIAASTDVDVPFVMAMQVARFLLVLALGAPIARYLSRGRE